MHSNICVTLSKIDGLSMCQHIWEHAQVRLRFAKAMVNLQHTHSLAGNAPVAWLAGTTKLQGPKFGLFQHQRCAVTAWQLAVTHAEL